MKWKESEIEVWINVFLLMLQGLVEGDKVLK